MPKIAELGDFHGWHADCDVSGITDKTTGLNVNTVPRYDPLTFGETALKMRSLRHEVLSSNLVNADTPNYKARDIDFQSVLASRLAGQADSTSLSLERTHAAHISVPRQAQGPNKMFRMAVQPSIDGNTVDPDIERGHFVKNAFFTESALSFLGSTLRTRLSAITGQPS
ncbi:MAG: flagellar basal body rod protein FlgB [Betaproteobacteria bacterium]|nr:flagellar basal body rod protein FlgB [Betaproteobacteria bacterium]